MGSDRISATDATMSTVADSRRVDVAVVGAGAAGLTCARILAAAGRRVVVIEKSRGVGGRLATRRVGTALIDHGAQFVTGDPAGGAATAFAATLGRWAERGVARPWLEGPVGPHGPGPADGRIRWRGTPGMTALAKDLAAGLDIRLGTRVVGVASVGGRLTLGLEQADPAPAQRRTDGERVPTLTAAVSAIAADRVVVTAPVPQARALLAASGIHPDGAAAAALDAVAVDPCIAALVVLDGPSEVPPPGAAAPTGDPVLAWIADNHQKGVSPVPALTLHGTPAWSREHWDESDTEILATMIAAAGRLLGAATPLERQVMRWRYSLVTQVAPVEHLEVADGIILAGDGFGGGRVGGAIASGASAAAAILAD